MRDRRTEKIWPIELEGAQGAGYYVGEENSREDGYWQRSYLNAFSATGLAAGTSQHPT